MKCTKNKCICINIHPAKTYKNSMDLLNDFLRPSSSRASWSARGQTLPFSNRQIFSRGQVALPNGMVGFAKGVKPLLMRALNGVGGTGVPRNMENASPSNMVSNSWPTHAAYSKQDGIATLNRQLQAVQANYVRNGVAPT